MLFLRKKKTNAESIKKRKEINNNIFKSETKKSKESKRKIKLKVTEKLDEVQLNKNANISQKSVKSEDGENFIEKNNEKNEDKKNEEEKTKIIMIIKKKIKTKIII